jgi:PIN domain nuclease of toxin-antitoxin system
LGLLLDTHYVYALAGSPGRLTPRELDFLAAPPSMLFVSAVSIWEIRLKWHSLHAGGVPKGPVSPSAVLTILAAQRITFVPLTPAHAAVRLSPPLEHNDPFDDLLLAQAQADGHQLLTRDAKLIGHPAACQVAEAAG